MKFLRLIPAISVTLSSALIVSCDDTSWSSVDAKIHHDFQQVKQITTAGLASQLRDPQRTPPVLLDIRTEAEYEVSHLKDAWRIQPGSPASAIQLPKDQPIVTYCSVGYRSGAFAQTLQEAGYTHGENLRGSIFKWANEGRPVFRDGRRVEKVHPYNKTWGLLLDKLHRAEVPPNPR